MQLIPGKLLDGGQQEFTAIFCKCEMMQLMASYLQDDMHLEEGALEFLWNLDFTESEELHIPVAKVRFAAIKLDHGPVN